MMFRFAPPQTGPVEKGPPSGMWINTDHIACVQEIRRTEPDDEPLALQIRMVNGERFQIDVANAGRGTAERLFAWLQGQDKMPRVEPPRPLDKGGKGKAPRIADEFADIGDKKPVTATA